MCARNATCHFEVIKRIALKPKFFAALLALLSFSVPNLLRAHHSTSTEFDLTEKITLSGRLTKVDWMNPHVMVDVSVEGAGGKNKTWRFESGPPSWFEKAGVSRADLTGAIGQTITVEAAPAKNDSSFGYLQKVTFADGMVLDVWRNAPRVLKIPQVR